MKKIRILQTPVRFYPYIGGVELAVYYASKELVNLGHEVSILCADDKMEMSQTISGIRVKRLKTNFKLTNTNICLLLPFYIFKSNFDIIHTHMPTPWSADWSILIAKLLRKKSFITIHCDLQKQGFLPKLITDIYLYSFFQMCLYLVDRIIIVNPNWRNTFKYTSKILTKYQNKISVIPNGVDLDLFNKAETKKDKFVLFISVLDKHHINKGLNYLIESFKDVTLSHPSARLGIIGDGELKSEYVNMTENMGLSSNVFFYGSMDQKQISKYIASSTIFVLPSTDTEAFGIVLLEAMACAVPVVTTDIVGPRNDIIDNQAGIVVSKKSSKEIADAIVYLFDNPLAAETMGLRGRKLVKENYQWKNITKKLLKSYKRAL